MTYKETIKIVIKGLLINKTRTFLSLISIIIGIAGLVSVLTLGEGKKEKTNEFVNNYGADIVKIDSCATHGLKPNEMGKITEKDIMFIKKNCPSLKEITEVSYVGLDYIKEAVEAAICGTAVEPQFAKIANIEIISGRFINETDIKEKRKVCVVVQNKQIKKYIKMGDYLCTGGDKLRVIGFVKIGKIFSNISFPQAFWPLSLAKEVLIKDGLSHYDTQGVYLQAISVKKTKRLVKEVERAIKKLNNGRIPLNLQPYIYQNLIEDSLREVNRTTLIMSAIAIIALFVGGMGIMNIMYLSVMERIKEIGIRRAIGATAIDITFQFLLEALFLCLSGGIIGIIIGMFVVYYFIPFLEIPFVISLPPIITGILSSLIIGIIAGIKPAIKASKFDPVEILR